MKNKKSLRILVLSSHFYPRVDGTTRSIDKIIKNLVQRGNHVSFITRRLSGTPSFEMYEEAKVYRIGPSGFSALARLFFGINQARLAIRVIRSSKIDIIQAHGFASMIAGFILKTVFNKPVVLFFHGLPRMWIGKFRWREQYEQLLSFPFEKFLIRQADRMIVRSNLFAKILIEVYGRGYEDRLRVLPHPVNTKTFNFHPSSFYEPTILFVGSLAKVYGVDLLLRAATIILEEIPESRFIIVGDGPLMPSLKNLARELGIEKSVRFTGRIDDPQVLADYYRSSTLVAIPLYYEGYILSLVAVEALSCGRPVVTTMKLEPDLEKIGVFTVKTHDPKDLAQMILHVLKDVDLKAIAVVAREYVERYHSEETYGSKLESIYLELIGKVQQTM